MESKKQWNKEYGNKNREDEAAASSEKESTSQLIRRPKMAIEQRAKQFMPFAAVTGLEKALREKEEEIEQSIK